MKKVAVLILIALELGVCGCGHTTPTNNITTTTAGNWEAQLIGGTGAASQLNFVTAFNVTDTTGVSNRPLDITGFSFFNAGACFTNGVGTSTEAGTATLNTSSTGQVTGSLNFTVTSVTPAGDKLQLTTDPLNNLPPGGVSGTSNGTTTTTGTLSNGIVWGNWSLQTSNTGCVTTAPTTVYGTFIMCQGTSTCTVP
jgi:hypothetical protein